MHLILLIANLIAKLQPFMKQLICIIFALATWDIIFAQQKNLLQNFKYRVDNYKALNLSIGGGTNIYKESNYDKPNKNLGSNIGAAIDILTSKDTRITNGYLNINASVIKGKSDPFQSITYQQLGTGANTNLFFTNKWYKKKKFIELNTYFFGNTNSLKSKSTGIVNLKVMKNSAYNFFTVIGVGRGRLENITDMQNALWLNKSLMEDNNLSRKLNDEELNNLAKSITKGKNTRVLDVRRRTKYVLKTVDNYLQEKGVVKKTDIDYFNNLNDNLFFANNNERLCGSEFYFRIIPTFNGSNSNGFINLSSFKNIFNQESTSISANLGYQKFEPQSLIHQNNYGVKFNFTSSKYSDIDKNLANNIVFVNSENKYNLLQFGPELFFEHAIYPSTRTIFNFRTDINFGKQIINKLKQNFSKVDLSADASYFINYRTRLSANVGLAYSQNQFYTNQNNPILPTRFFASANINLNINL